jgi:hypothetical protein
MPPRLVLLPPMAVVPAAPARAAETCPFISDQHLAGATPVTKWSLISNQTAGVASFRARAGTR